MTDKRDLTPAEESIPLRVIVYLMTIICIGSSCFFVKTAWPVYVLSGALATIGSIVSYQYRHDKQSWMQWVVIVGVFAVGANAAMEFMDPTNGATDFWGPVVHFVAGTFALHTFDLKSRSDINLSAMLGALILCLLSPVVRGNFFGLAVFSYICLGTAMLYFDCMSRTLHNWLTKPMQPAPLVNVANTTGRRKPRGSVYFTIALLPLFSILGFLLVPRSDNLVDNIMASLKHIDTASIMKMMPTFSPKMPDMDVTKHEFSSPLKNKIEMKKKKHELENQDEVDKELAKMGVDKRKLVDTPAKPKPKPTPPKKKAGPPEKKPKEKDPASARQKNNRPKDNKLVREMVDLDTDAPDSVDILYKTTATRLFFSRHSVFDAFDGRYWKRSKEKIKVTNIDIKDKNAVQSPAAGSSTDASNTDTAANTAEVGPDGKELSAEAQADKEIEQEKLIEQAKRDTGFSSDMNVDYVFNTPAKGEFHIDQAAALHVAPKMPAVSLTQNFEVVSDIDNVLPSAWIPQQLNYKGNKLTVDDYGQITTPDAIKKGTKFNVISQWPIYDLKGMRAEPLIKEEREKQIRDDLANYLEMPESLSPEVLELADSYAGKTGNWFTVAERICMTLRANHTLVLDRPEDYKAPEDRIKTFLLDSKDGTHKDFTSAFIMLCRCEGLPARFVYGFSPGLFNKTAGVQDVRMCDATSWAEVFIPDYGWVPFDATPGGVMPGVKRDEGFSIYTIFRWICEQLGISADEGLTPQTLFKLVAIGMSLVFLLVGMVLAIIMLIKYRNAQRDKHPWNDAAWKIWRDLARDFKKARMERMPSETPTEFVDRIKNIVEEQRRQGTMNSYDLPNALREFFTTYEAVHFGNKDGLPVLKSQAAELKKMVKANKVNEKKSESSSPAVRGRR